MHNKWNLNCPNKMTRSNQWFLQEKKRSMHQYNNHINFLHPIGNALCNAFSSLGLNNSHMDMNDLLQRNLKWLGNASNRIYITRITVGVSHPALLQPLRTCRRLGSQAWVSHLLAKTDRPSQTMYGMDPPCLLVGPQSHQFLHPEMRVWSSEVSPCLSNAACQWSSMKQAPTRNSTHLGASQVDHWDLQMEVAFHITTNQEGLH